MDIDKCINMLKRGEILSEKVLRRCCEKVKEILIEESNVQPVNSPVTLCGDIHGQFFDLLQLFKIGGEIPDTNYIFMGDFVDRGYNSVETFELLMCLKIKVLGWLCVISSTLRILLCFGGITRLARSLWFTGSWMKSCESTGTQIRGCILLKFLTCFLLVSGLKIKQLV